MTSKKETLIDSDSGIETESALIPQPEDPPAFQDDEFLGEQIGVEAEDKGTEDALAEAQPKEQTFDDVDEIVDKEPSEESLKEEANEEADENKEELTISDNQVYADDSGGSRLKNLLSSLAGSKKKRSIVGGIIAVVVIATVLAVTILGSSDASRKNGSLPNLPLVMSQCESWDESTWSEKMNLRSGSSSVADDLSKHYRSFDTAVIYRPDRPGDITIRFHDTSADSLDATYGRAQSIVQVANNRLVRMPSAGIMFTDAEIDGAAAFNVNDAMGFFSEGPDPHNLQGFNQSDAEDLLAELGIKKSSIEGGAWRESRHIPDTGDLTPASSSQNNLRAGEHYWQYQLVCKTRDSRGADLYITVNALRKGDITYLAQAERQYAYGRAVIYPSQIAMTQYYASEVEVIASRSSASYDALVGSMSDSTGSTPADLTNSSAISLSVQSANGNTLSGTVHRDADDYVIADSSYKTYTKVELEALGLSEAELCIAWNEPFARNGYHFKNSGLQSYFESCSWYKDTGWSGSLDPGSAGESNNALLKEIAGDSEWLRLATN